MLVTYDLHKLVSGGVTNGFGDSTVAYTAFRLVGGRLKRTISKFVTGSEGT